MVRRGLVAALLTAAAALFIFGGTALAQASGGDDGDGGDFVEASNDGVDVGQLNDGVNGQISGDDGSDADEGLDDPLTQAHVIENTADTATTDEHVECEGVRKFKRFGPRGAHAGDLFKASEVLGLLGGDREAVLAALMEGQTLAQIAEANGSSGGAVVDAVVAAFGARAAEAGKTLSDDHVAALREKLSERVNNPAERGARKGRFDNRRRWHHKFSITDDGTVESTTASTASTDEHVECEGLHKFKRFGPRGAHAGDLFKASEVLGLLGGDREAVRTALMAGQTLAQIAEANGSSGEAVVDAVVDRFEARAAEAGKTLSEENVAALREKLSERVNNPAERGARKGRFDNRRRWHHKFSVTDDGSKVESSASNAETSAV